MNRITKLIHRVKFNTRQRRTVSHFKKYVISKDDIAKDIQRKSQVQNSNDNQSLDKEIVIRKLLRRFDPEDDKWDRRALFEVAGIRLYDGDFLESDTSDEET